MAEGGGGGGDYSPLSLACVRALSDKTYDKRRAAGLEVEKYHHNFRS